MIGDSEFFRVSRILWNAACNLGGGNGVIGNWVAEVWGRMLRNGISN